MANDPDDTRGDRTGAPPDGPPRDRILPQVIPQEGWTGDQHPAIEELCAFVVDRYPDADQHALRGRLSLLLTNTVGIVAVGLIEGQKPATFIRDAMRPLRTAPHDEAVETLCRSEPVLQRYLDLHAEAGDAGVGRLFDRDQGAVEPPPQPDPMLQYYLDRRSKAEDTENQGPMGPDPASVARAEPLLTRARDLWNDVLPQPCRSSENPWATVADWVAELLAEVTGREPKRSYNNYARSGAGADAGWPLAFFRRFAALAVPTDEPPRLDRVWRDALEARKRKIKAAIIAGRV